MASPAADARAVATAAFPDAAVLARSRNSITHEVPSVPGKRIFDTAIGPMHFGATEDQEIDTDWQTAVAPWDFEMLLAGYNARALQDFSSGQIIEYLDPVSGEDINFQPQQLQWTNDLDQIDAIASPQAVNAVATGDELFWTGAYGTDIDLRWHAQTARLDKRLIIQNFAALPAPAAFIEAGGNPVLRLQFIFQITNGIDIFVDGVLWNKAPNNPVETADIVEFRSQATGLPLWQFTRPRSFMTGLDSDPDNKELELVGIFRFRKTGPNLIVEHRIPLAWLQTATYPVEIDTTIDEQVGADDDDADEADDNTGFDASGMTIGVDRNNTDANRSNGGFRFQTVAIGNADTIDVATMTGQFNAHDDMFSTIWANDVDDAADFATDADVTTRIDSGATAASVNWDDNANGTDVDVVSPSLVTIIQEIVDRAGWASNNDIVMLLQADSGGTARGKFYSYEGDTTKAMKLHVEFTAAAGANAPTADIQGPLYGPLGGPIGV